MGEAFVASRSGDRPAVCMTRNDVQPSICWIVALDLMEWPIPNGPWKRDAAWDANPKVEKERGWKTLGLEGDIAI